MTPNDLESILRGIKPAAPSAQLFQGIDEELSLDTSWLGKSPFVKTTPRWITRTIFTAIGAAAAIAVMSWITLSGHQNTAPRETTAQNSAVPVSTISEWADFENEGIQFAKGQPPQQRVRLIGTERRIFIDPRDGAQIIIETPKEQSFTVPVNFQ